MKSILGDLVNTGLVYRTGQSEESVYRFAPPEDLARLDGSTSAAASALVWTNIYRNGPLRREELAALVPFDGKVLDESLASLLAEGRVQQEQRDAETVYVSKLCFIPLGDNAGWEAALLDHHGALVAAICSKLRNGQTRALPDDQVGGSTFSMDVWPGHPKEEAVTLLLHRFRVELSALWQEIVEQSKAHVAAPGAYRVTFYCGQYVSRDPALEP